MKTHPSLVQTALNKFLKHCELYSVKESILKFLNKICDSLIHNCEISREDSKADLQEHNFVGSREEIMNI